MAKVHGNLRMGLGMGSGGAEVPVTQRMLLVFQGFDGVELGGAGGGERAEDDADQMAVVSAMTADQMETGMAKPVTRRRRWGRRGRGGCRRSRRRAR